MATMSRARQTSGMDTSRYEELERMLQERRREIASAVQEKMRDVRSDGAGTQPHGVVDDAETSESDIQDDIELALIQMKAETLNKIDEASSGSSTDVTGIATSVAKRLCNNDYARCRSPYGVATARRSVRSPNSVTACSTTVGTERPSSPMCRGSLRR